LVRQPADIRSLMPPMPPMPPSPRSFSQAASGYKVFADIRSLMPPMPPMPPSPDVPQSHYAGSLLMKKDILALLPKPMTE
jgi:hypothetical protein